MFINNCNLRKKLGMGKLLEANTGANSGANTGADSGNGESAGEGNQNSEGGEKSFDDVLKDRKYQSEFDRRVAKALETAKVKWDTEKATELENVKTEAEKMAKMSEEQKQKALFEKQLEEFEKEKKAFEGEKLLNETSKQLIDKKLPESFAGFLVKENADETLKNIEAFEKEWKKTIEKGVNEQLRGGKPPKGGSSNNKVDTFGFNFTGVRPKNNK